VVHLTPCNLHGEIVQSVEKPLVKQPESIHKQEDLPDLFEPRLQYMHAMITTSEEKQSYVHSKSTASASQAKISKYLLTTTLHGQIVQTGSIIKSNGPRMTLAIQIGDQDGTKHKCSLTVLIRMKLKWSVFLNLHAYLYTLEVTPAISSGIVQVVKPYH